VANLFEDSAPQRILKDAGIEQATDFAARSALNQDRAQEAQRISFEQRSTGGSGSGHRKSILLHDCRDNLLPDERFDSNPSAWAREDWQRDHCASRDKITINEMMLI